MRLDGIQTGDIVEVDRLGRRFHALVTGQAPGGLALHPLDKRVTYRSCRAPRGPDALVQARPAAGDRRAARALAASARARHHDPRLTRAALDAEGLAGFEHGLELGHHHGPAAAYALRNLVPRARSRRGSTVSFTASPAGSISNVTLDRGSAARSASSSPLNPITSPSSGVKLCHV